jgi:hypothetical protein
MYGQDMIQGSAAADLRTHGGIPLQPQQEFGVRSAMERLIQEVNVVSKMSSELRSVLGISVPEKGAANGAQPSSLVGLLQAVTDTLARVTTDLEQSVRHLNA